MDMTTPATIVTEALWSKQELLRSGINQVEVNEIASTILSALHEKGIATIKAADLWAFDAQLNGWLNSRPESVVGAFLPTDYWIPILRQMPRKRSPA